ncbi:ELMO domain-containing protein 2 [Polypterus senegalus]
MFLSIWNYLHTTFFRYWLKWLIRQVTGKCELQRIFHSFIQGATRTIKTEYSLEASKSKVLRDALQAKEDSVDQHVTQIMKQKKIQLEKDAEFKVNLKVCLLQICGYKNLMKNVEDLRKQVFDSENDEHEALLMKLWKLLMPNVELDSRISKQWGDIGFQGDDPKTDFRGMGMLGLANLVFFSEQYPEVARQVLSHSNHPKLGYSYAIVGINLTEMAYSLLSSGVVKPHFYNLVPGSPQLEHFQRFYSYLVYEFDKFWFQEEPESIMLFNQYREKFHEKVKRLLQQPSVVLVLTLDSEI